MLAPPAQPQTLWHAPQAPSPPAHKRAQPPVTQPPVRTPPPQTPVAAVREQTPRSPAQARMRPPPQHRPWTQTHALSPHRAQAPPRLPQAQATLSLELQYALLPCRLENQRQQEEERVHSPEEFGKRQTMATPRASARQRPRRTYPPSIPPHQMHLPAPALRLACDLHSGH